jgi:hypothetical protein
MTTKKPTTQALPTYVGLTTGDVERTLAPLVEVIAGLNKVTTHLLAVSEEIQRDIVAIMDKQINIQQTAFSSKTVTDLAVDLRMSLAERGLTTRQDTEEKE